MTDQLELDLRAALADEAGHDVGLAPQAHAAWVRGRRRHRRVLLGASGVGAVVAAGAGIGVAAVVGAGPPAPGQSVVVSPLGSPGVPGASGAPTPQHGGGHRTSGAGHQADGAQVTPELSSHGDLPADRGLDAVSLPDPAPGFPIRRMADSTSDTGGLGRGYPDALIRTFLVTSAPETESTPSPGVVESDPTGQEVSILVGRAGSMPVDASDVSDDFGEQPVGTTSARGVPAVVVTEDGESGVVLRAGDFDIAAYGWTPAGGTPVTTRQLDTLIDSLTGVGDGYQAGS